MSTLIRTPRERAASIPFALRLEDKSCYFYGFDKSHPKCGNDVPGAGVQTTTQDAPLKPPATTCKDPGDKKCKVCCEVGDCDAGVTNSDLACANVQPNVSGLNCATVNQAKQYNMTLPTTGKEVDKGQVGGFDSDKCGDNSCSKDEIQTGKVQINLDSKGAASTPFAIHFKENSCVFYGHDKSYVKCGKNVPAYDDDGEHEW